MIGFPSDHTDSTTLRSVSGIYDGASELGALPSVSLSELGITEEDNRDIKDIYPIIKGKGDLQESLAVCEMVSLYLKVPFRHDMLKKLLKVNFEEINLYHLNFLEL